MSHLFSLLRLHYFLTLCLYSESPNKDLRLSSSLWKFDPGDMKPVFSWHIFMHEPLTELNGTFTSTAPAAWIGHNWIKAIKKQSTYKIMCLWKCLSEAMDCCTLISSCNWSSFSLIPYCLFCFVVSFHNCLCLLIDKSCFSESFASFFFCASSFYFLFPN